MNHNIMFLKISFESNQNTFGRRNMCQNKVKSDKQPTDVF